MFRSPCPSCGANLAWTGAKVEHESIWRAKESCPKCGVRLRRARNVPGAIWVFLLLFAMFFGFLHDVRDQWGNSSAYMLFGLWMVVYVYLSRKNGYELDKRGS